jgi:uncharacterized OB-fold protein
MSDQALVAAAAQLLGDVPVGEELAGETLLFQHCDTCGYVRFPPAPVCPECLGVTFDWQPDSGLGTVWSYCIYHRAFDAAFAEALPYNVALVELDSGPRLISNVLGVQVEDLRVGMRVIAVALQVAPGRHLIYFNLEEPGERP